MRLPWVSRHRLDDANRQLEFWRDAYSTLSATGEADVKRLTDIIIGMKRDNFHPVQVVPTETPRPEDQLPDEVQDALDQIGLSGMALEQHKDWARRRLRKDKPDMVAEALLQGGLIPDEAEV